MKRINRSVRGRPPGAAAAQATAAPVEQTLEITAVGGRGDGVARGGRGVVQLPFSLPGDQVRVRVAGDRAEIAELLRPSAARVVPPCRHFGRCGGCQLQHWRETDYLAWKRDTVGDALAKRG